MSVVVKKIGRVVQIRLNRPEVLNAINVEMKSEILKTVLEYDKQEDVGCFVLCGNERAFAAGADISDLDSKSWYDMASADVFAEWENFTNCRTPKIAAVNGYALGGGCELAMMCDVIYASDTASFGQPEIKLGLIPGMGGTQRLTRLVGRTLAMDMILTGRNLSAEEAERAGLVARIFPHSDLESEVMSIAKQIADFGKTACRTAIESVNRADEVNLREGLLSERRNYHGLWNTEDKEIGMKAFLNKDKHPKFSGK